MDKILNPKNFESKIYKKWEENDCFNSKYIEGRKTYSLVLPPPNITGELHMGHTLNSTIQDTIVRYKRMDNYNVLWLPGTDHASIATEVKVANMLLKETGKTKKEIGREEFLKHTYAWKEKYGNRILEQLKRIGDSCDWSKLAFTMDEHCSYAVRDSFVKLYNKGLIYRGNRLVTWCPTCQTALSDAEVEYEEQASHLWHIRYDFVDGSGSVVVATTRPETLLGDTAVAVNSKDERYFGLVGKMIKLPLTDREIPLIADEYVEMEFGTGAVKITPAHDVNDFEVGKRHDLPIINLFDANCKLNENAGKYQGLDLETARKRIVEDLEKIGALVKVEPYKHNVGVCYRCHNVLEPVISDQWYVKMDGLAKPAIEAVEKGEIKFIPKRFEKNYFNWMRNIRDWCISRQLWWGHRIPAWYCDECGEINVAMETPKKCKKCGCEHLHQDEDVLDTWFSSALWPFSTMGYPDETEDLAHYYPNSIVITGYDIIPFWISRMVTIGLEHTHKVPFKEVMINGIVRDALGRKMSKSLGNGIEPIQKIEKYGADAVRCSLLMGLSNGMDINYNDDRAENASNFMNKLWNAGRYVLMNIEGQELGDIEKVSKTEADKWILNKLNAIIADTRENLEKYELGNALSKLYAFVWNDYCDWYIELSKSAIYSNNENEKRDTLTVLTYVWKTILKLLHPFIPFITEEMWESFDNSILMLEHYPEQNKNLCFENENFDIVKEIIEKIRFVRADMQVANAVKFPVFIVANNDTHKQIIKNAMPYFEKLCGVTNIEFVSSKDEIKESCSQSVTSAVEFFIPLGLLVDSEKELARLNNELSKLEVEITRIDDMLNKTDFALKAPADVVQSRRDRLNTDIEMKNKILEQIEQIKALKK